MPMERVSATLEREVVEEIRRLQQTRIQKYLQGLYAKHGAPDPATRREAEKRIKRVLGR